MTNKLIEGKDFYYDDNGLLVFTSLYLSQRGYCCGNGCRNCPYDYVNVPEPRRTSFIAERLHRHNDGLNSDDLSSTD